MRFACMTLVAAIGCQRGQAPPGVVTPELELVNPGTLPHVARYHLTKDAVASLELATDMTITVAGHEQVVPTLVMDLDVTALDVAITGTAQVRTTITGASTTTGPAALQDKLAQLRGIAIVATLSPDGKLRDAHVELGDKQLPPAITAQLASVTQSFEQIAMPLPTQPIGVGARWRSTRTLRQNGIELATTTVVDVTALDGDRLGFTMSSEIGGQEQDVDSPAGRIHMSDIHGSGTGRGTIDLGKMTMAGEVTTAFHAEMTANGQRQAFDMRLKVSMRAR